MFQLLDFDSVKSFFASFYFTYTQSTHNLFNNGRLQNLNANISVATHLKPTPLKRELYVLTGVVMRCLKLLISPFYY